ncbi:MAG TPA: diaminopimelate epimerase [Candidatus Paceibacterota bacterium]|nr:diaminopimelate epimerase [Candidatus Paceibacterota bacterium]
MNIYFTKMHGLGNDFVVIDNFNGRIKLSSEQIKFLCDRKKGIGADGLILVEATNDSKEYDCFMNYYNADGTQAEMCGNGVRCVALFLKEGYLKNNISFKINTRAGIKKVEMIDEDIFSVNMGVPVFEHSDFPEKEMEIEGMNFQFVSMGNPHAVTMVAELDPRAVSDIGPRVENSKFFPNKTNVEFVKEINPREYEARVWERGCGETLACGTGACAIYAILKKRGNTESEIVLHLLGGKLKLTQNTEGEIIMEGPAVASFSGMVTVV